MGTDFYSEGYRAFQEGWADVEPEDVAEAGPEAVEEWFSGWYRAEEDAEDGEADGLEEDLE